MQRSEASITDRGPYHPVHEHSDRALGPWQSVDIQSASVVEEGAVVSACVVADIDGELLDVEASKPYAFATFGFAICMFSFFIAGASVSIEQLFFIAYVEPAYNVLWASMRTIGSYPDCSDLRTQYWRLWTSQFVHGGLYHFLGNLIELLIFGVVYEDAAGLLSWIMLMSISCPIANIIQALANPFITVVGASGTIYALMGGCFSRSLLPSLSTSSVPHSTKKFVCICVFLQVTCDVRIFMTQSGNDIRRISFASHVTGFVSGFCLDWFLLQSASIFRRSICVSVFVALFLVWTNKDYPPAVPDAIKTYSQDDYSSVLSSCCELKFLSLEEGQTINMDDYTCT